jgi:hypothetical protein
MCPAPADLNLFQKVRVEACAASAWASETGYSIDLFASFNALPPELSFDTLKSAQKQKTLISKKSATNP